MVIKSEDSQNFSATIDYWMIDLDEAIEYLNPQSVLAKCIDSDEPVTTNWFCNLVSRDTGTGYISNIDAIASNGGLFEVRGIDFQGAGRLMTKLIGTRLDRHRYYENITDKSNFTKLDGVHGHPKWEALLSTSYDSTWGFITWRARYLGNSRINYFNGITDDQYDLPYTGSKIFHDLYLNYHLSEKADIRFSINNVFDNKPPQRAFDIKQGLEGFCPNAGRMYYLGLPINL